MTSAPPSSAFDGLPLFLVARDRAMAQVGSNAGQNFVSLAMRHAVKFLRSHGPASGEEITDDCRREGIIAHDDRAMGVVIRNLSRDKIIEACGEAIRKKGHGARGATLWRLKK